MVTHLKDYLYTKGTSEALDREFAGSEKYGKVHISPNTLFWRVGFTRYCVPLSKVSRIFRRLMPMHGRLCAGGYHFDVEYLCLNLKDGSQIQIHIGNDIKEKAETLLKTLKKEHPELEYGCPEA